MSPQWQREQVQQQIVAEIERYSASIPSRLEGKGGFKGLRVERTEGEGMGEEQGGDSSGEESARMDTEEMDKLLLKTKYT